MSKLNTRQKKFINAITKGATQGQAALIAGYSPKSAKSQGSKLLQKENIRAALDNAGLSDKALATSLKQSIETGIGVKATNADAIRGIDLATRLKGHQVQQQPQALTQTNIYINELKELNTEELASRVEELTSDIKVLQVE